jgi:hypothetical protein
MGESSDGISRQQTKDTVMDSIITIANDETLIADAYARVKGDLAALSPDQLVQVNVDIQAAAGTILGVLPEVRALRDRMAKELPAFDLVQFDKLEDYVLALTFTQARMQITTLPPDDLQTLSADATTLREQLVADAKALSLRGLLDPRTLDQLKGANGYKNVAQDLQILSTTMQDSWSRIQGKSATTADELQAASRIATRLIRVIGIREQGPTLVAAATDQRMRAFTLVLHTYQEARDAVGYLRRHEGDADSIAPSLYPGVAKRRHAPDPAPAPAPADGTHPATAVQIPAATPATAGAITSSPAGATTNRGPFTS